MLHHISRLDIDDIRWNNCLDNAINSRIYAYTWYLDAVCDGQWAAFVWGDYEAIMPLPYNRKLLGVKQIYPPFYTQQLGIFYGADFDILYLSAFWAALPKMAYLANIRLNSHNTINLPTAFKITTHPNHLLDLQLAYADLHRNFNSGLQRRLRQAAKRNFVLDENVGYDDWAQLYLQYQAPKMTDFKPSILQLGAGVMAAAVHAERGRWLGLRNATGDLVCVLFLLIGNDRIVKLASATTPEGRQTAAYHWLVNLVIAEYAEQPYLLDFEGSSIAGIAEFNESFGAQPEIYYTLHYNGLPPFLRWLKQ
jgi:hypothetical protein